MTSDSLPGDDASRVRKEALNRAVADLALSSTGLHPDDIPFVVGEVLARAGVHETTIYLADLEQHVLVPFCGPGRAVVEALTVDGTVAGRCYRTEAPVLSRGDRTDTPNEGGLPTGILWLPLMDSAERLGVMSLTVPDEIADDAIEACAAVANTVGELIANKAVYGDLITRTRRTRDLTIAAELRWSMIPPLTYSGRHVTISAVLAPAYEIAGDTFDYAVNGDEAHIAIIDAVGHGLDASRIANLGVVAYRHARRRLLDLAETYAHTDRVLAEQIGGDKFATAQFAVLTMSTGRLQWVNAGHPAPMMIRQGRHLDLQSEVSLPLGLAMSPTPQPRLAELYLEPGDRLLFFTDGITEARSPEGELFGRSRLADLTERAAAASQLPAETVRLLAHAVLAHQQGVLQDDATLLLLAWRNVPG